jgi:hypothetical protein
MKRILDFIIQWIVVFLIIASLLLHYYAGDVASSPYSLTDKQMEEFGQLMAYAKGGYLKPLVDFLKEKIKAEQKEGILRGWATVLQVSAVILQIIKDRRKKENNFKAEDFLSGQED